MIYWVEIDNDLITSLGKTEGEVELNEHQFEISEQIFLEISSLPAHFERDGEGNIVKVMPIEQPPVITYEPIDEEKLAMAEAIIQHEMEIQQLKAELAALKKGEE